MADLAKNRVWTSLTDDESAALDSLAKARGMRQSEVVRAAVLEFLKAPQGAPVSVSPGLDASLMARLEGVAATLERTAMSTRIALDMAYASEAERKDVREALTDIAMSIGVLAGSIEPSATADNF
jgi:predicted transcriptional regulator